MTDEEFIRKHIEVEKSLCEAVKKAKANAKSEVLKALEDVRVKTEALGIWHDKVMIETVDINRVLEVIDDKIKEIEHE